jgi:hypothetical protein
MRLVRAETDARRWRLRCRFFELVSELRPDALKRLLGLKSLYARDWPRPIITPIRAHSIWTQVVDTPPWLDAWMRQHNLEGSTDQWVEKTALFTLKHYLGPGRKTPADRSKFVAPSLTPLSTNEHEVAAGLRYEPKPFRYDFPAIDQIREDRDELVKQEVKAAATAWRRHLQAERCDAEGAGYTWDKSRQRRAEGRRLRRLVQFQVLERGWAEIAREELRGADPGTAERRTVEAQQNALESQAAVDRRAQEVQKHALDMARLIGLPPRHRA